MNRNFEIFKKKDSEIREAFKFSNPNRLKLNDFFTEEQISKTYKFMSTNFHMFHVNWGKICTLEEGDTQNSYRWSSTFMGLFNFLNVFIAIKTQGVSLISREVKYLHELDRPSTNLNEFYKKVSFFYPGIKDKVYLKLFFYFSRENSQNGLFRPKIRIVKTINTDYKIFHHNKYINFFNNNFKDDIYQFLRKSEEIEKKFFERLKEIELPHSESQQ